MVGGEVNPTVLERLARFAAGTDFATLPSDVAADIPTRFLDTIGIALASRARGLADGVLDLVQSTGGRAEARPIGEEARFPSSQAALVNGTLAHALDFDDTHLPSVLHPSASVIPAALAMGEAVGASGAAIVAAAAIGLEITVRVGMGGYLPEAGNVFFERGWHATSICGTLGSAAAAGHLLDLDSERIGHAISIAASMGSGLLEANRTGGTVKRLHCGWAAHAGIVAASLAARGYTGPRTVFEGRFGFYRAFLDGVASIEAVVDGLGERWEVPGIAFKPYPANHYTHSAIDAAVAIRERPGFDVRRIRRIRLGAAAPALRTIAEPRDEKIAPRSGYHAQFSGPFVVATALLGHRPGLWFDDFTDQRAHDPRILGLASLVETFVDPECDRLFPTQFPAVVEVEMVDGQVEHERVMTTRGGRDRPMTRGELLEKFRRNAGSALPADRVDALARAILSMAGAATIDEILTLAAAGAKAT